MNRLIQLQVFVFNKSSPYNYAHDCPLHNHTLHWKLPLCIYHVNTVINTSLRCSIHNTILELNNRGLRYFSTTNQNACNW